MSKAVAAPGATRVAASAAAMAAPIMAKAMNGVNCAHKRELTTILR